MTPDTLAHLPSLPPLPPGWKFLTDARSDWRPRDAEHPIHEFIARGFKNTTLNWDELPPNITTVAVPVFYVSDAKGHQLDAVRFEPRIVKEGTSNLQMVASASQYWVLSRPQACIEFEKGNYERAMALASMGDTALHRNVFLKARAALETREAFEAFKVLFRHMSFSEELWRLERLMEYLPFDLEEHEGMVEFHELMRAQIGHLRGDASRINAGAIRKHYAEDSPFAEGVNEDYANVVLLTTRLKWLIDECRKNGYARVAEYGSINGTSLFPLLNRAPDIEWHGFEVSEKCIAEGRRLALEVGKENFNLHPMREFYERGPFDAVALFEVLEHNDPESGQAIVQDCLLRLRVGGTLFITTPCGNWSGWSEECRDLMLKKDHILAFTPARMATFLGEAVRDIVGCSFELMKCERVENEDLQEANAWVHAQVRRLT
ncbi:MAG: hypothetical protein EPN91_08865 [Salinibacterium sp.]|nr:MAG: hypothetical protein EPN91_08865 [Salinibacterium sp.]